MEDLAKAMYTCKMCEKLLKDPKMLPCKHNFCKNCIQSHCLHTATADAFSCPTCRDIVKVYDGNIPVMEWADTLPTNNIMESHLDNLWKLEEEKNIYKCILCIQKWKSVRAVKFCKSCEEYFCNECGNQHWLLRSSKEHRVWLIEDLAYLKNDPLLRARLELIFSAKYRRPRTKARRRSSLLEKHDDDTNSSKECDITGACFVHGNIVLADRGNEKLILVDRNYVVQNTFKTACFDVVAINQYYMAVSCPEENQVKILSVYNDVIEEDRTVSLNAECFGVCRVGSYFAVGLASKPMCLHIYSGSILQEKVYLECGNVYLKKPRYLAYHEKTDRFYISDSSSRSLKSFNKAGSIIWEKRIDMCNGLEMFDNYLLVARSDRNTIDMINLEGKILKSVVSSEDGLTNVRVLSKDDETEVDDAKRLAVVDAHELVHVFVIYDPMADCDLKTYVDKSNRAKNGIKVEDEVDDDSFQSKFCTVV